MKNFKILIVEDEVLIAEDLSDLLRSFGISEIDMAHDKPTALNKIEVFQPDLILLDIRMESELTGIQIAEIINAQYKKPFIFITAHSDLQMLQTILKTIPAGYITKPIKKTDLYANVLLVSEKLKLQRPKQIMIKDGTKNVLIDFNDLLYIESEGNYIVIHTTHKKHALRQNMDSIMAQLDNDIFYRVQRSYVVNIKKVSSYSRKDLTINGIVIPISKNVVDDFEKVINNQI